MAVAVLLGGVNMKHVVLLNEVASTDTAFEVRGANWVGRCLICNGPMAFDRRTGEGASLEHIRARSRGGTDEALNLAIVHPQCNWEKGRRWDARRRRGVEEYEVFVARLLARRQGRFRSRGESNGND